MSRHSEQERLFREAARRELTRRRNHRRDFLTRSLVTGLGLAGVEFAARSGVQPALRRRQPSADADILSVDFKTCIRRSRR